MSTCTNCGNQIDSGKYCSQNCSTAQRFGLSMREFNGREKLFTLARKGDKKAMKTLKREYGITAIWNGGELVKI